MCARGAEGECVALWVSIKAEREVVGRGLRVLMPQPEWGAKEIRFSLALAKS
jgi:hypothetical protein